jgi:hypothetical protein
MDANTYAASITAMKGITTLGGQGENSNIQLKERK